MPSSQNCLDLQSRSQADEPIMARFHLSGNDVNQDLAGELFQHWRKTSDFVNERLIRRTDSESRDGARS